MVLRIGLIQIDGKLPNLALMKLSAWHKAQGHETELLTPSDVLRGQSLFSSRDKLYGATVFRESRDISERLAEIGVEVGGTGWNLEKRLPDEIENMKPDYELYGINYGFGFNSRGCIRQCSFCVVPIKEGKIRHVAMPNEVANPKSKVITLLDNNFLADSLWCEKCQDIIEHDYRVDFCQGLDIRILTAEQTDYLRKIKLQDSIRFAFDNIKLAPIIREKSKMLIEYGFKDFRKKMLYILVNYNSTLEQDLERIGIAETCDFNPFVMVYDKAHAPQVIKDLAVWCNRPWLRKSCTFKEYKPRKAS